MVLLKMLPYATICMYATASVLPLLRIKMPEGRDWLGVGCGA